MTVWKLLAGRRQRLRLILPAYVELLIQYHACQYCELQKYQPAH